MKSSNKIIARLFVDTHRFSEYGHINVNFSVVKEMNGDKTPTFEHYDRTSMEQGVDELTIISQLSEVSLMTDPAQTSLSGIYGYDLHYSGTNPAISDNLELAIKTAKTIRKRVAKFEEKEGRARNYSDYLKYIFRSIGVTDILFEEYSGDNDLSDWTCYKLSDIDDLLIHAASLTAKKLDWSVDLNNLPSAA